MRPYLHILALFLSFVPALVCAASVPSLTTYDISYATICPNQPTDGCPASTTIDVAFSEKVNAGISLVAQDGSVIQLYKSSSSGVSNPNPKTWDGTDKGVIVPDGVYTVSISAISIEDSTQYMTDSSKTITVSATGSSKGQEASSSETSTATTSSGTSGSAAAPYVPPPSALSVQVSGTEQILLEVPATFSAVAKAKGGAVDSLATMHWSFGDGSSGEGGRITKTYHYPGTYLVVATATDGPVSAQGEIVVTVTASKVRIAQISGEGITIANESGSRLDVSDWRITSSKGAFRVPVGTTLLPNASVLFPFAIMNVPVAFDAVLAYPNGRMAAEYAPAALGTVPVPGEQLVVATTSYNQIQAVESIINQRTFVPVHEEAVIAPTPVPNEGTGVGAALPEVPPAAGAAPAAKSLFKSPWMLGLGGIIALAAGAFVLL